MEFISPLTNTAIRFCTVSHSGTVFGPEFVTMMRERYGFWTYPQSPEEFKADDGIKFAYGRFEGLVVSALSLYTNGIFVQADMDTDFLDRLVDDFMTWATATFGCIFAESAPVSRGYTSVMVVRPSADLDASLSKFHSVSSLLTAMVGELGVVDAPYTVSGFLLQTDPAKAKPIVPGRFAIERRANTAIEDRLWFAEAPVSTTQHRRLLETLDYALQS